MVKVEGLAKLLREHPFFRGMDSAHHDLIAGCAANEQFKPNQYIFHEGGPSDKFYVVRHGSVAIEVYVPGKEPIVVETLQAGDILGWSWVVAPYRWTFDARAVELTRCISLDAVCLRGKCEEDHSLGYEIYRRMAPVMANRLAAARLRLIDMYGHPVVKAKRPRRATQ